MNSSWCWATEFFSPWMTKPLNSISFCKNHWGQSIQGLFTLADQLVILLLLQGQGDETFMQLLNFFPTSMRMSLTVKIKNFFWLAGVHFDLLKLVSLCACAFTFGLWFFIKSDKSRIGSLQLFWSRTKRDVCVHHRKVFDQRENFVNKITVFLHI